MPGNVGHSRTHDPSPPNQVAVVGARLRSLGQPHGSPQSLGRYLDLRWITGVRHNSVRLRRPLAGEIELLGRPIDRPAQLASSDHRPTDVYAVLASHELVSGRIVTTIPEPARRLRLIYPGAASPPGVGCRPPATPDGRSAPAPWRGSAPPSPDRCGRSPRRLDMRSTAPPPPRRARQ